MSARFLLDTHVWLWLQSDVDQIGKKTLRALRGAELFFSVASAWEITIKIANGKLELPESVDAYIASRISADKLQVLEITLAHTAAASQLPPIHRDPFDRLLVAQAGVHGLTLLTADETVMRYEVSTRDATL